ncbi:DUF3160 domain-containing protein [Butyrivibrio sp. FCS014]|uniref:DUF3160 domain-containing protein n=1 Tax=Butyrivibrio sp. FCS014 TaxID=1408304 RepID=UPI000467A06B|nr:DUF3160 domain-containing protein [Butyrivibrio sp. FCS014]
MKKRLIALILTISMVAAGCGAAGTTNETADTEITAVEESGEPEDSADTAAEDSAVSGEETVKTIKTSLLGDEEEIYYNQLLKPCVEPYTIAEDFSNVVYAERFANWFDPDYDSEYNNTAPLREALIKNGFAVNGGFGNSEFFDVYEDNRYLQFPSFVTVDSLMHTYHLYFAYLMKKTEMNHLSSTLEDLGKELLAASAAQAKDLTGTDWEDAAKRNTAFFYVGSKLLDSSVTFPEIAADAQSAAEEEISKIMDASGIDECFLTGLNEDYTQYKPRGYYEGTELEPYFRSMMWYGRIPFALDSEEAVKSAILMTMALKDNGLDKWESIYNITAFFAGKSDDPGYVEIAPVIEEAYGKMPGTSDLASNKDGLSKVMDLAGTIGEPKINSIPVMEGDDPVIPSFRFMGQRFTIDAAIMQRLIYSAVKENGEGERRYLPDTFDTMAALGSDTAMELLKEQGATEFEGYTENLNEVKELYNTASPADWNASIYAGWLNTLRPLLEKKGEGYPSFMQSEEWAKKDLETFAGSYAELKHDTILYAKQVMAEMGGGDDEEVLDDRGYVEPEPVVYSRFLFLSEKTRDGLDSYGMLEDSAREDLTKLSTMAKTLLTISEKELVNEALTDEEYEFIKDYGGDLEHFWYEVNKDYGDIIYSYESPCPVIADIATDPNGSVLEVGTGEAQNMYVVFPIDGEIHVARGSVYSFYQFVQPMSERLTDSEWRDKLSGGHLDENWNWVENKDKPVQPDWTQSYRYHD